MHNTSLNYKLSNHPSIHLPLIRRRVAGAAGAVFLTEHHGLGLGGADSHPSRFTLGCKPPQCMPKVPVSRGQQDNIIHKKQRRNRVVPKPDTLRHLTAPRNSYVTCTGNKSDILTAMRTKLLLRLYRDRAALRNRPRTPYSQSPPYRTTRGTQSNAFSKSTKHMWIGWANSHAPSSTLERV